MGLNKFANVFTIYQAFCSSTHKQEWRKIKIFILNW